MKSSLGESTDDKQTLFQRCIKTGLGCGDCRLSACLWDDRGVLAFLAEAGPIIDSENLLPQAHMYTMMSDRNFERIRARTMGLSHVLSIICFRDSPGAEMSCQSARRLAHKEHDRSRGTPHMVDGQASETAHAVLEWPFREMLLTRIRSQRRDYIRPCIHRLTVREWWSCSRVPEPIIGVAGPLGTSLWSWAGG